MASLDHAFDEFFLRGSMKPLKARETVAIRTVAMDKTKEASFDMERLVVMPCGTEMKSRQHHPFSTGERNTPSAWTIFSTLEMGSNVVPGTRSPILFPALF